MASPVMKQYSSRGAPRELRSSIPAATTARPSAIPVLLMAPTVRYSIPMERPRRAAMP